MLRSVVPFLESVWYNVRISGRRAECRREVSHRYLPDRQLPDKAVSVLDTACARLALGQNNTSVVMEDAAGDLTITPFSFACSSAKASATSERVSEITKKKAVVEARLAELQARWDKESGFVNRIREVRPAGRNHATTGRSRGSGHRGCPVAERARRPAVPVDMEASCAPSWMR